MEDVARYLPREYQVQALVSADIPVRSGALRPVESVLDLLAQGRLSESDLKLLDLTDQMLPLCQLADGRIIEARIKAATTYADPESTPFANAMHATQQLRDLLVAARSAWSVSADGQSLVRRIPEGVESAFERAIETADSAASRYLQDAFSAAFGRHPAPGEAYKKAIQAVEVAAAPVVAPKDGSPSLGKMIAALRDRSSKWRVEVEAPDPVDRVRWMMELLWLGHTDRHGGAEPRMISKEAAEGAVFLASTLVYWFGRGVIRPA